MPRIVATIIACAAFALCGSARATTPTLADAAPSPKSALTLQNFGRANAGCLEWTDSCAVCRLTPRPARADRPWSRRGGVKFACSTPGIACLPGDIVCRQQDRAK